MPFPSILIARRSQISLNLPPSSGHRDFQHSLSFNGRVPAVEGLLRQQAEIPSPLAAGANCTTPTGVRMEFQIDLDPTHDVIRLTLTSGVVDLRCAEEVYTRLQRVAYVGGPYAGIYDLSAVTGTIISPIMVRGFAQRAP